MKNYKIEKSEDHRSGLYVLLENDELIAFSDSQRILAAIAGNRIRQRKRDLEDCTSMY